MDHVSEFKAKCKENSSSLSQVLGRNLKNQYSMMRNHNEKINYSKIAKLCGVSPATVHRWFNNCERLPGIKDLLILAIIFGCHVSELIECSDGRCQQEYYPKRPYVERLEAQERYYYGDGDMILQKVWDFNETIEYLVKKIKLKRQVIV